MLNKKKIRKKIDKKKTVRIKDKYYYFFSYIKEKLLSAF